MVQTIQGQLSAEGRRFALVVSRFNELITRRLLDGALDCLSRHNGKDEDVTVVWVPGSFEVPLVAQKLAQTKKYDAVVCLAAVIRGGTDHYQFVASEAAKGIAQVGLATGVPSIFGVLTCESMEEALERAGAKQGNKGWQAALSAIEMADLAGRLGR
jgi:6,7-dimethyl-8-ribityllumazine synthase